MKRILQLRSGGNVKRFHTVTMHREHLVASHSWGVAAVLLDIDPSASRDVLVAALYHDVAESVTGDVPATTKWRYPKLSEILNEAEKEIEKELGIHVVLEQYERDRLKFADMVDLILSCLEEYSLGNREALVIAHRGVTYLESKVFDTKCTEYLERLKQHMLEQLK